ncbi:hypothetical protein ABPG74_003087 [Tetrahymena malaccensis]
MKGGFYGISQSNSTKSLNDPILSRHGSSSSLNYQQSNEFDVQKIPQQTLDTIEKMQQLRNKFPYLKSSYNSSRNNSSGYLLGYTNVQASEKQITQGVQSQRNSSLNMKTNQNENNKNGDEIKQLHKRKKPLSIDFNAIYKINQDKILPEMQETKSVMVDYQNFRGSTSTKNLRDKKAFDFQQNQSLLNLPEIQSLPKNLVKNFQISQLLRKVGEHQQEFQINSPHYMSRQSSRYQSYTTSFYPSKKKKEKIDISFLRVDFFQSDDSYLIKLPKIQLIQVIFTIINMLRRIYKFFNVVKISNLESFDEYQVFDEDPLKILQKENVRAHSKWSDLNGNFEWLECQVKSYNPETKKFMIRWIRNHQEKEVSRLNLIFENETIEQGEMRYKKAKEKRDQLIHILQMRQSTESQDGPMLQYQKDVMKRIFEKIFTFERMRRQAQRYESEIINEILYEYKFNMIKFIYDISKIQSIEEYYQINFPHREIAIRCTRQVSIDKQIECQNLSQEEYKNIVNKLDKNTIAIKYVTKTQIQKRVKIFEDLSQTQEGNQEQEKKELQSGNATPKTPNRQNFGFITSAEQQKSSILQGGKQNSKETTRYILVKETKFNYELSSTSHVDYLQQLLKNDMVLSVDKKYDVVRIVLPMVLFKIYFLLYITQINKQQVVRFIKHINDHRIFKFISYTKNSYKDDALIEFKNMQADISKEIKKIIRVLDKIQVRFFYQLTLHRLIYLQYVKQAVEEMNLDNRKQYYIQYIDHRQADEQKEKVLERVVSIVNSLVYSNLNLTVEQSFLALLQNMETYYSILPFETIYEPVLKAIYPEFYEKRIQQRIKLRILENKNKVEVSDQDKRNLPIKSLQSITNQEQFNQQIESDKFSRKSFKKSYRHLEADENNQNRSLKNIQSYRFTSRTTHQLFLDEENETLCNGSKENHLMRDSKIIFYLYQSQMDILLTDYNLHMKYLDLNKLKLKPIFTFRVKILSEKISTEKKIIHNIKKSIQINKADNKQQFENILDIQRGKLYEYKILQMRDIFDECAKRNFSECDLSDLQNIDKKGVIYKRLGWFNLSEFLFQTEPSLETFENEFKNIFQMGISQIQQLKLIQKEETIYENEKEKIPNYFNQKELYSYYEKYANRIEEFLIWSVYGIYSFMAILLKFEFYFLFSSKFEPYLQNELNQNSLTNFFEEIERMQRDRDFVKINIPNYVNLGVILLDVQKFKVDLIAEIDSKIKVAKVLLQQKCEDTINLIDKLNEEMHKTLDVDPVSISEFITMNIYLQGENIQRHFLKFEESMDIINVIVEKLEKEQIEISSYIGQKLMLPSMLKALYDLKSKKEQKQREMKIKFQKMHSDKKNAISQEIDQIEIEIFEFKKLNDISNSFANALHVDTIKQRLELLAQKVEDVEYEQSHFQIFDEDPLPIQDIIQDFDYYYKLWKFSSDWKYKKENWLSKPLVFHTQNSLNQNDMKEIAQTLEQGMAVLKEVGDYFEKYNHDLLQVCDDLENQISEFENVLDLLNQVRDEAFKIEHWIKIFEVMYPDNEAKKQQIRQQGLNNQLTLDILLKDDILGSLAYVEKISGQARKEHQVHQSILNMENELKDIKFIIVDYHGILMIKDIQKIVSLLRSQFFQIEDMIKNKNYHKEDFAIKLSDLEFVIKNSRKTIKDISRIQNMLIQYYPIFKFKKNLNYLKEFNLLFNRSKDSLIPIVEELSKRGMSYFINIFIKSEDEKIYQEQFKQKFKAIIQMLEKIGNNIQLVIKHVRSSNSRYFFMSNHQILHLCSLVLSPLEFMRFLTQVFPGIIDFKISVSKENDKGLGEEYRITSIINEYKEEIKLDKYKILHSLQEWDDPPTFTVIREIELFQQKYIKQQISQFFIPMVSNSYNYTILWNFITSKQTIFQVLFVINDIIFYHDLSMIIYLQTEPSKDTIQNLIVLRDTIQNQLKVLVQGVVVSMKQGVIKEQFTQASQFILQIRYHLDIINYFLENQVFTIDQFEYLILPKITLDMPKGLVKANIGDIMKKTKENVIYQISTYENISEMPPISKSSDYLQEFQGKEFNISMISLNYKMNYQYEIIPILQGYVFTPCTNKIFVKIASAFCSQLGSLIVGPEASGKLECVKALCFYLAKPLFIWEFDSSQKYDSVNQILTGVSSGGYWLYIKNLQNCSSGILSTLAQIVFLIRKSLVTGQKSFQLINQSYVIQDNCCILGGFNIRQDTLLNQIKFEELPKGILENFRCINVIQPNHEVIIKQYFLLLGFDDIERNVFKMQLFLEYISTYYNSQILSVKDNIDKEDISRLRVYNNFSINQIVNLKSLMLILRYSQDLLTQKKGDVFSDPTSILQSAIENYFKCSLTEDQFKVVIQSFKKIFDNSKDEFSYKALFSKAYESTQEKISQWLNERNVKINDKINEYIQIMLPLSIHNQRFLLYGQPGKQKSFLIKLLAFISSRYQRKNFFLNWIKVDGVKENKLIGGYDDNGQWSDGILIQMMNAIRNYESAENQDFRDIMNFERHFCSQLADQFGKNPMSQVKQKKAQVEIKRTFKKRGTYTSQNSLTKKTTSYTDIKSEEKKPTLTDIQDVKSNTGSSISNIQKSQVGSMVVDESKKTHSSLINENEVIKEEAENEVDDKEVTEVTLNDWFILDISSSMNEKPYVHTVDKLLKGIHTNTFSLSNQGLFRIPKQLYFVVEMESLKELNPESITSNFLICAEEDVFNIQEEFESWVSLKKSQNKFYHKLQGLLKWLFTFFFQESMNYFSNQLAYKKDMIFKLSDKGFLKNFLNYLEIFLNEFRKYEISCGELDWNEAQDSQPLQTIQSYTSPQQQANQVNNNNNTSQSNHVISPTVTDKNLNFAKTGFSQAVVAQNVPKLNLRRLKKRQDSVIQTQSIQSEDEDESIKRLKQNNNEQRVCVTVEAIFIFNLIWGIGISLRDEIKPKFENFLQEQSQLYVKYRTEITQIKSTASSYPFAQNIWSYLQYQKRQNSKFSIFDMYYDITKNKWQSWKSFQIDESSLISCDFYSNYLESQEIIRLNPAAIDVIQNKLDTDQPNYYIPDQTIYIETISSKIANFFTTFALAYEKPFILSGQTQNGVSSYTKWKMKAMIEKQSIQGIYICLSKKTQVHHFQKKVEINLIEKTHNTLMPTNNNKAVVFIDDLNLCTSGPSTLGALRYFQEHGGWFSNSQNRYFKLDRVTFCCMHSHSSNINSNIFQSVPITYLSKQMVAVIPKYSEQELITIFSTHSGIITSSNLNPQLVNILKVNKLYFLKLLNSIFKQTFYGVIALSLLNNYLEIKSIENQFGANLSLKKGLEIVKNLNFFEFLTENKKNINPQLLYRSLVFLINQYFSSEFIHNLSTLKDRLKAAEYFKRQKLESQLDLSYSSDESNKIYNAQLDIQNIKTFVNFADNKTKKEETQEDQGKFKLNILQIQIFFTIFINSDEEYHFEIQKIKEGLISNYNEIQKLRIEFEERKPITFEQHIMNFFEDVEKQMELINKQKLSSQKVETSFLKVDSQPTNQPMRISLRINDIQENQYQIITNDDQNNQVTKICDQDDEKSNLKGANYLNIPLQNMHNNSFKSEQKLLGSELKIQEQNYSNLNTQVLKKAISSTSIFSPTQQNRFDQIGNWTPNQTSRQINQTQLEDFQKQLDELNSQSERDQQNVQEDILTAHVQQKVREMTFMFDDLNTIPDQFIVELTKCIQGDIQIDQEASFNMLNHRNDILFFNNELMQTNQNYNSSNKRDQGVPSSFPQKLKQNRMSIYSNIFSSKIENQKQGNANKIYFNFDVTVKDDQASSQQIQIPFSEQLLEDDDVKQFCFVTKKKEIDIFNHILELFKLYSEKKENRFLMDDFLLRESNLECLFYHTIKMLHLFQISSYHIFLNSLLRKQSALSIIHFISYILSYQFFSIDLYQVQQNINVENKDQSKSKKENKQQSQKDEQSQEQNTSDLKEIFLNKLYEVMQNLFQAPQKDQDQNSSTQQIPSQPQTQRGVVINQEKPSLQLQNQFTQQYSQSNQLELQQGKNSLIAPTFEIGFQNQNSNIQGQNQHSNQQNDEPIIFFINISQDTLAHEETMKSVQEILDIIHSITNECEILSILTKSKVDKLISEIWKLDIQHANLTYHHLYILISKKMAKRIKFVLNQEPKVNRQHMYYIHNQSLFKNFTKYTLYNISQENNEQSISQKCFTSLTQELVKSNISKFKNSIISFTYPFESQVSQVYEEQFFQNIHRTYEETCSLFFLLYNILSSLLRKKIKQAQESGSFSTLMLVMLDKQMQFEEEIKNLEDQYVQIVEKREQVEITIAKATEQHKLLQKQIEEFLVEEKRIQEQIDKVIKNDQQVLKTLNLLAGPIKELNDMKLDRYKEQIDSQKFIAHKPLNSYMVVFFIMFNKILPEEHKIELSQIENDIESTKKHAQLFNANEIHNQHFYKQQFANVIDDYKVIKNIFSLEQFNVMRQLGKSQGSLENASNVYLSINLNLFQREILKFIELNIELCRSWVERSEIKLSIPELREQLQQIRTKKADLEYKIKEPIKLLNEMPSKLQDLKSKEEDLKDHLAKQTDGIERFKVQYEELKHLFQQKIYYEMNKLTDQDIFEQFLLNLSLYGVYCMKYPYFIQDKIKSTLQNNHSSIDFTFNHKKIFTYLYDKTYYLHSLKLDVPLNQDIIDTLVLLEFLQENDSFYYPFVIDPSQIFMKYLKKKYDQRIIIESYTCDTETLQNIEEAMKTGQVLVIQDFDQELLNVMIPIIEWKNKRMNKLILYYMMHYNQYQFDEDLQSIFINEQRDPIVFNNKLINVHKSFRVYFVKDNQQIAFSHTLFSKLFTIMIDLEDEERWKVVFTDLLISIFHKQEKEEILLKDINKFKERELIIDQSISRMVDKLMETHTSEDKNLIQTLKIEIDLIQTQIKELIEIDKIEQSYRTEHQDPNQLQEDAILEENIPITKELDRSNSSQDKKKGIRIGLQIDQNSSSSMSSVESEHEKILQIQIPENRFRNQSTIFKDQEKTPYTPGGTPSHSSVEQYNNKRLSFIFNTKKIMNEKKLDDSSELMPIKRIIDVRIKKFYNYIDDLAQLANIYIDILDFLYGIRLNSMNLKISDIYSFSDAYFMMVITQASLHIKGQGFTTHDKGYNIDQKFKFKFCEEVYNRVIGAMQREHQLLYGVYLAVMFLRGENQFNEFEWKMISNWVIQRKSIKDISLHDFNSSEIETKFFGIESYLNTFFQYNKELLAPLQISNTKDQFSIFYHQDFISAVNKLGNKKEVGKQNKNQNSEITNQKVDINEDNYGEEKQDMQQINNKNALDSSKIDIHKSKMNTPSKFSANENFTPRNKQTLFGQQVKNVLQNGKGLEPQSFQSFAHLSKNQISSKSELDSQSQIDKHIEALHTKQFTHVPSKFQNQNSNVHQDSFQSYGNLNKANQQHQGYHDDMMKILQEYPLKKQEQVGYQAFQSFIKIFQHIQEKTKLKYALDSLTDMHNDWISFINTSLRIPDYDENKLQFFPKIPYNIHKRMAPIQLLLVMKHFRPDELKRFFGFFIRKAFKNVIIEIPKSLLNPHLTQEWSKRPTVFFYNNLERSIFEVLELKAQRLKIDGGVQRIPLGVIPIEQILYQLEVSSGAGQWLLFENIVGLSEKELSMLLKKIDKELEAKTTQNSFKIFISYQIKLDDSNIGQNNQILEDFLAKCWKISLNEAKSLTEQMEHLHIMELEEYRASKEVVEKVELVEVKLDHQTMIESTQLPFKSKIKCRFHEAIKYKMKIIQQTEFINLHSFLDKTFLGTNYSIYKNLIAKYTNKYKFALRFILLLLKTRYKVERYQELSYLPYQIVQITDFDIYNLVDDIFFYLEAFPNDVQLFLEKFICFFFEQKSLYNSLSCFSKSTILKQMNLYAFSSLDSTIKVHYNSYIYEMYNFNEGYFHTVEEAQYKKIESMPKEDPIEIFGLSFNDEVTLNYTHSHRFLKRVNKIEKNWNHDKYSKLLNSLDQFINGPSSNVEDSLENNQAKDFFFMHLSYLQQQREKDYELITFLESLQEVFQIDFDINKLFQTIFISSQDENNQNQQLEKGILNIKLNNDDIIKLSQKTPLLAHQNSIASSTHSIMAEGNMTPVSIRNTLNIGNQNSNIRRKSNFNIEANLAQNDQQSQEQSEIQNNESQQHETIISNKSSKLDNLKKKMNATNSQTTLKDYFAQNNSLQKYFGRVTQIAARIHNNKLLGNFRRIDSGASIDSQMSKISANHSQFIAQNQNNRYTMKFKDIYTTCLINELMALENIFLTIRQDISNIIYLVRNGEFTQIAGEKYQIIKNILNNKCPEKWWKLGFLISELNLTDFIKHILIYYDYIRSQFQDEMENPQYQIQINKLINPMGLLTSMIHQFSLKNNVLLDDVKIKMKQCQLNRDPYKEQTDFFIISGFFIRRGKFGSDLMLLDEDTRQFEQQLPLVYIKVELKVRNKAQAYKTISQPQTQRKRNLAIEFTQQNNQIDLESDYYFQQENPIQSFHYDKDKLSENNSFINQSLFKGTQKKPETPRSMQAYSKANQIKESIDIHNKLTSNQGNLNNAFALRVAMRDEITTKKEIKEINLKENQTNYPKGTYVVRIPVVNPSANSIFTQFPLEIYFYVHSNKPQEYWEQKRTQIHLQKINL